MSRNLKPMLVILGVLVVWVGWNVWRTRGREEVVPWRLDIAAARAEAAKSNKPLLLYFTATWCGPCQVMKREVFSQDHVAEALKHAVPVKIDIDRDKMLAGQYGVEAIPHLVMAGADGVPMSLYRGGIDAQEFVEWVKSALTRAPATSQPRP